MTYLWLIRWPPYAPLVSGDAVYSRNLMEALACRSDVSALAFRGRGPKPPARSGISWTQVDDKEASRLSSLASPLPSVAHRHDRQGFIDTAVRLAGSARAVLFDLGLSFCVKRLAARLDPVRRPPLVVINHNNEAELRRAMAENAGNPILRAPLVWDGWKAARMEHEALRAADGYTAITQTDLAAFEARAPAARSLLLTPGYDGPTAQARRIDASTPNRICILGGRGGFQKQVVLMQVLQALQARSVEKSAIVDVVGGGSDDQRQLKRFSGFNFLGYVEDLPAYLKTVRLGLIPDQVGGGFKMRALTHVFLRTPMLAVDAAMAGMGLRPDLDYVSCASVDAMASSALAVAADVHLLNRVQNAAFDHCRGRFDWIDRGAALGEFLDDLADRR